MARVLPPPAERFDPTTALWVSPGGLLYDPQRDDFDPEHGEPLELVGPIPPELAELDGSEISDPHRGDVRWRRRRWMLLAFVAFGIAALVIGGSLFI